MYAVKFTGTLRVAPEGEIEGLDLHEHGGEAYPEAVISHHSHAASARTYSTTV
jgi:ammonium transporter, Amt family